MKLQNKFFAAAAVLAAVCLFSTPSDSGSLSVRPSSDTLTLVSNQTFNDDVLLQFGSGGTAHCLYETADANANILLCAAPEGGGTDVPGFVWGDASAENVDIGFFNGLTDPFIGVLSDDNLSYTYLAHDQTNSVIANNEGDLIVNIAGGNFAPSANDGAALGIPGTGWSDAFLASGAIINFAAGDVTLTHSSNELSFTGGNYNFTQPVFTAGSPTGLEFIGGAHTTLAASVEASDINLNLARNVQFATGALASQNAVKVTAPTYSFVGPSTLSDAITVWIDGAPRQGTNATLTNAYGLVVNKQNYLNANVTTADFQIPGISDTTPGAIDTRIGVSIDNGGSNTSLGNQTATLNTLVGLSIRPGTFDSTTNLRTVSNASGLLVETPSSGTNVKMETVYGVDIGSNNTQVSQAGLLYADLAIGNHTLTLTGTEQVSEFPIMGIGVGERTITDVSAVTVDNAASIYVEGPPLAAGSVTLTNAYSLWVDDGISRFDGTLNATGGGALTGTWSDLGSVTTVDVNGGSVDGATVGAASASTGKFTTLEATGLLTLSTTAAITASTTQTQGQGALTTTINNVSVCVNANDTVTLPAAAAGVIVYIFNNGAETLQVFPASGDAIDGAAANTAVTMTATSNHTFIAHDTTNWNRLNSAL